VIGVLARVTRGREQASLLSDRVITRCITRSMSVLAILSGPCQVTRTAARACLRRPCLPRTWRVLAGAHAKGGAAGERCPQTIAGQAWRDVVFPRVASV
jgi:hypothetical protein